MRMRHSPGCCCSDCRIFIVEYATQRPYDLLLPWASHYLCLRFLPWEITDEAFAAAWYPKTWLALAYHSQTATHVEFRRAGKPDGIDIVAKLEKRLPAPSYQDRPGLETIEEPTTDILAIAEITIDAPGRTIAILEDPVTVKIREPDSGLWVDSPRTHRVEATPEDCGFTLYPRLRPTVVTWAPAELPANLTLDASQLNGPSRCNGAAFPAGPVEIPFELADVADDVVFAATWRLPTSFSQPEITVDLTGPLERGQETNPDYWEVGRIATTGCQTVVRAPLTPAAATFPNGRFGFPRGTPLAWVWDDGVAVS